MNDFETKSEFLLNEFSKLRVEIKVNDHYTQPYEIIDNENGMVSFPKVWEFQFIFNEKFPVESSLVSEINLEYHEYIEKKKIEFYKEIDELVISDSSPLNKISVLNSCKMRFAEVLKNYVINEITYLGEKFNCINNKIIKYEISEDKLIDNPKKYMLLSSFLIEQKRTIKNILKYIDNKTSLISHNMDQKEVEETSIIEPEERLFKPIKIRSNINILVTLFYDLKDLKYIETSSTNLRKFILKSFSDNDGMELSEETIKTILNHSKEVKRANIDVRIKVPFL